MTIAVKIRTVITCYDYPSARAFDESYVDMIFVGDSVGTNVLGYQSEIEVTMGDMLHHFKAVRRGVKNKPVMVDMPYGSYASIDLALENAALFWDRGADIIKIEGGESLAPTVSALTAGGVAIMGHIGFQPQLMSRTGHSVVGATADVALQLYRDAQALRDAGAKWLLLECVPEMVAKDITEAIGIPTIGIGSGKYCTGQVLVSTDLLGWYDLPLRFVKRYDRFAENARKAINRWVQEVVREEYPARNHGFRIRSEELAAFRKAIADK